VHADLADLDLGQRQGFFQGCDLDGMGAFQDWNPGLRVLRELRPDLADWAAPTMTEAKKSVAANNLLGPRGSFDLPMIERQLGLTGTPRP
jgi:hypothetical protein